MFGGSVAQWFSLQQGQSFATELTAKLGGGYTVELLNFGLGAFKQPQTTFALSYFLLLGQRFDAVVLLDGFNEAALSWVNASRGVSIAWPSVSHMDMFDDVACLYEMIGQNLTVPGLVNELASLWEEGARMMHATCRARGIPFFHVLQPNQYYSRKVFGEEELSFAVSQTSPYGDAVRAVYPELVERMRRFEWHAYDATGVFDHCPEIVYSDNCCHYNRLGNSMLGDFILTRILESGGMGGAHGQSASVPRGGFSNQIGRLLANRLPRRLSRAKANEVRDHHDDLYPMW